MHRIKLRVTDDEIMQKDKPHQKLLVHITSMNPVYIANSGIQNPRIFPKKLHITIQNIIS